MRSMRTFGILVGLLVVLAASVLGQDGVNPRPAPKYLGKQASDPPTPCVSSSYYYNTASNVVRDCLNTAWVTRGLTGGSVVAPIGLPNGTAGAPSIFLTNSPTTGFFRSAADAIGVSTAGTERWTFNASGALNPLVSKTYDIGGSTTIRDIGIGRNAIFSGATSGSSTVHASATAGSGDLTLPTGTDTLVGLATTDTLTNKTLTSPVLTTPNLGTPSTLVLTNATGTPSAINLTNGTALPVAGITASTVTALGVGSIELGHATDTTISRVSSGKIAVEGVNVVTTSSTDTLTNKTFDTAGTGNSFSINGVAATANTGTGAVARADSPTFTTTVALPTSVTVNGNAQTFPTSAKTLAATDYSNVTAMPSLFVYKLTGVNFNSANSDNSVTITLPSGYTRYQVSVATVSHASASLTTSTWGVFSAAAGGGVAIIGNAACTVSATADATANNFQSSPGSATTSFTTSTLFFRIGTAQGSAATADVTIVVRVLP
jgi:hypothetical protein